MTSRQPAAFDERSARLEALGRITGGVAHDVNDVLMVVLSGIELVRKRTAGAEVDCYLDALREAVERGTAVTRELLVFSRGSTREVMLLDLRNHLKGFENILRQSLRGDIRLELDSGDASAFVEVDVAQLDLALLNMAANSRDAMPDGGSFKVPIGFGEFPGRSGRSGVLLDMTDTGSGISPYVLPRVFESFFTTKEIAKGTDLGHS
ncbi:sensor histidine kinase [Chthonobacter rhizosphaerae]|uniref:sensor histidine kinase n=1 Tax=Chthonobacter rhizosphaerae TaxID=2735553 RepID=UPI0015EF1AB7|nr:ATP-binding protein [Chthonobacter rhizosphaerae]